MKHFGSRIRENLGDLVSPQSLTTSATPRKTACFQVLEMLHSVARRGTQLILLLHQLDTHAIGGGDVTEQRARGKFPRLHRERGAFRPQFLAQRFQVSVVREAKMIRAPLVMARIVFVRMTPVASRGELLHSL